jgi:hypothetical protein
VALWLARLKGYLARNLVSQQQNQQVFGAYRVAWETVILDYDTQLH